MAYIWLMVARFAVREEAVSFTQSFDCSDIGTSLSGTVSLSCGVEAEEEDWTVYVVPRVASGEYLNGHGGPADDSEEAAMREVGLVLYDRLRASLPSPESRWYAIVGTEVGDWMPIRAFELDGPDLKECPVPGLILSKTVYRAVGSPSCFVPFGSADWVPWTGPRD